jgi:hypothetical protein
MSNGSDITLRDYFAAHALQGDLCAMQIDGRRFGLLVELAKAENCTLATVVAREAYEMADAMMKAREQ